MKTYKIELRHAHSKNRLNALKHNRLPPQTVRLNADEEAIGWARLELLRFFKVRHGPQYSYVEAGLWELPMTGPDTRRVGRWVANGAGVNWRPRPDD